MASAVTKKTYGNLIGYTLQKVESLDDIDEGDHVAFPRGMAYKDPTFWHHAIVEKLYPTTNEVGLIHYFNSSPKTAEASLGLIEALARIMQDKIPLEDDELFKVCYDDPDECLPKDEVLKRARSQLGEGGYNVLTNNCEHFSTWCKTGKKRCGQVLPAVHFFGAVLSTSWVKGITTGIVEIVGSVSITAAVKEAMESGTHFVGSAALQTVAFVTIVSTLVSFSIETAFTTKECLEARKRLRDGKITQREFDDIVGKRVAEGVGDIAGGVGGIVVGVVVGAMIGPGGALTGGILGGMTGGIWGRLTGWGLGKAGVAIRDIIEHRSVKDKVRKESSSTDIIPIKGSKFSLMAGQMKQYAGTIKYWLYYRETCPPQKKKDDLNFFEAGYHNQVRSLLCKSVIIVIFVIFVLFMLTWFYTQYF